jgi:4-hydroxybenzoate polyprenyltransferase
MRRYAEKPLSRKEEGNMRLLDKFRDTRQQVVELSSRFFHPHSSLSPYLRLMRVDKPTGTWLLLLPCWWGVALSAKYFPNIWLMFLFAVGAIVMRGAGCVINDIYDRRLDRRVERTKTRPLASGEVTLVQALLFLGALLLVGLGILLLLNRETVILGVLSLALIFTYPLMKRITWWPQLFLGFTFNWGILMASTATMGRIGLSHFLAYAGGVFWTLAYDTIYAHQDKRDDVLAGVKSTALLLGEKSTQWIALFYAATLGLVAAAGWVVPEGMNRGFYLGLLVAACFAAVQLIFWKPDDPENCMTRFKANRDFGLIVLVAIVIGRILG